MTRSSSSRHARINASREHKHAAGDRQLASQVNDHAARAATPRDDGALDRVAEPTSQGKDSTTMLTLNDLASNDPATRKRVMARYRQLVAQPSHTAEEMSELQAILSKLNKTPADAQADARTLRQAESLQDSLRDYGDLRDRVKEADARFAKSNEDRLAALRAANEAHRTNVEAHNAAHAALRTYGDARMELSRLMQQNAVLFDGVDD